MIAVNKDRPVNLDLGTIRFPVTSIVSITHRVTGVFLIAATAVLLYLLDLSMSGAEGFAEAVALLDSTLAKLVIWAVLAGLIYHATAGVRHLLMDAGLGETLEGGRLGARLVFAVSIVLIIAGGIWLW